MIIFQTFVFLVVSILCGIAAVEVRFFNLAFVLIIAFWGLSMGYFIIAIVIPLFGGFIAPLSSVAIGAIGIICGVYLNNK